MATPDVVFRNVAAVQFAAHNDQFKVIINGKTLFEATDDTYLRKSGALVVQAYNNTVTFDNARYIPASPPSAIASTNSNDPATVAKAPAKSPDNPYDDEPIKPLGPRKSIFDFCGEE